MTNKTILFIIFLLFFIICQAQKKAVTESGDEVILYQNGTWKYSKDFINVDSIRTNKVNFKKSNNSSFLLKSQNGKLGFWLDPQKWNFKKATLNTSAEFELELKGESLQAVILTESAEIPIESYVSIALENGKLQSPDFKITNKEYRIVNNLKILHLQMEGTQMGIKYAHSAYYFSDSNVTVQFLAFTYQNSMKKYLNEVEELLNGLVVLKSNQSDTSNNENRTELNNSRSQGSLSPYNNCKKDFIGNWEYDIVDPEDLKTKKIYVERTLNKTYEFMENKKFYFEYDAKWINDCKYELTFVKTNKPNWLIKKGEMIKVEILVINKNEMKYSTTFRGEIRNAQMTKSL